MTVSNWLTIAAIVAAPFAAVFAQRQIDLWRERHGRKLWIFKTLMATRGQTLSPDHVQALNMIDLEFTEDSEEPVRAAWGEYRDHLNSFPREGDDLEARRAVWQQRTQDLLASLLEKMGKSLRYKLDPVQIRKGAYFPEAHAVAELELQVIRRALITWLSGGQKVSVSIVPVDDDAAASAKRFADGVIGLLDGKRQIRVQVSQDQGGGSGGEAEAGGQSVEKAGTVTHNS